MTHNLNIEFIAAADLDRLIEQASIENWSELVLLGPFISLDAYREQSLKEPKCARRIFQLRDPVRDLASRLSGLGNLTSLNLWGNRIGPDGARVLATLGNLTSLNLNENKIGPEGAKALATLGNLSSLDLWFNGIGPEGAKALARLSNLTSLDLNENEIGSEGAKALAALGNLTSLTLWYNEIGLDGAKALATLSNLTSLDLSMNEIGSDSARALAVLSNLTSLDLWGNRIGPDGAKALAALGNLTSLHLVMNKIGSDGVKALAALSKLTSLNLRNNEIGPDGVRSLAALSNLNSLNLNENRIGSDGAKSLAALNNLTSLNLWGNEIGSDGAESLAALGNLMSLNLRNNEIGPDGVRSLAVLSNLSSLNLDENRVGSDGAKALATLKKLSSLDLSRNQIGPDGAKALAVLGNLTSLDLRRNEIGSDGARSLAALGNLTSLNLSYNWIGPDGARAILEAWSRRSDSVRFRRLDLRGAGDLSELLPEEVLSNYDDPEAILAAYRRFTEGRRKTLNEAKLLVVGKESVGKTSLLRYLINNEPRNPAEQKTAGVKTHDRIEVQRWKPGAEDIRLNVWDFGGQEIYYETHRFFLTARSLYLLVLSDREEDDQSIFHWLKAIKNRAAGSPILVVINKSDEGKPLGLRPDETGLCADHPEIIGFLRTSCDDNDFSRDSIQRLRERIVEAIVNDERMKHVRDSFPVSWLRIKHEVADLAARRAWLSLPDFYTLCAAGEREEDNVTDEGERRSLLRLLNDLGAIVAHGLDASARAVQREITLLDPNWLTRAIYTILTRADCAELQGEFTENQVAGWLDPAVYPPERHEFILDMMRDEEVGLCFPLPNKTGRYLVPEALGPSAPYLGEWPDDCLRFRYRYELLPRGMIPRFIVHAHRLLFDPPTRWRTGAVFQVQNCAILVEADLERRQVDIRVKGPVHRRRIALGVIIDHLEAIHALNAAARPRALVPLPDQPECHEEYDFLLTLEDEEGSSYRHRPTGSKRSYTVAELLDGVRQKGSYAQRDDDRSPELSDPSQPPELPEPPSTTKFWARILKSWNALAFAVAAFAVSLFLLIYSIESPELRFLIAVSAATFVGVFLIVASFNPDHFYRRLIAWVIGIGLLANVAGFGVDAYFSDPGIASFRWDGRVSITFNIAWPLIVVALLVRDWKQKHGSASN